MRQPLSTIRAAAILIVIVAAALVEGDVDARPSGFTVEPGRMSGTVASVQEERREVSVMTGVGLALRLVVFHAVPDCRIVVAGEEATLAELGRGAVVHVVYRATIDRYEALEIEAPAREHRAGSEQ